VDDFGWLSVAACSVESVFELKASPQVAEAATLDDAARLDDAAVIDAMGSSAREENAACARRLAWMGELYARRAPEDDDERTCWAIDGHANVVAEISAALNVSRGRAAGQLQYAIALRERLPKVLAVFLTGVIDFRMMAALVNRSDNVTDPQRLAKLDAAFAKWAPKWMKMSGPKLTERIDMWVEKFDPAGVREPRPPQENRYVDIGPSTPGMAGIWGQLPVTDGVALDERLDEVAATVCRQDPRTTRQRRADALVALAAGQTRLECGCGSPDCPAATGGAPKPRGEVVIHVLAEQASLSGTSEAPGYLPGFGPVPAPMLRELAESAKLKPLPLPSPVAEPGYRPSAAQAEFIRWRDVTCRFPGCDQPAVACQIDHTVPWPLGPTHPSNLKLYCPYHHLLKTFYSGPGGWSERQLPDGTLIVTTPTGHVYTTKPGGALFFPQLAVPTGELVIPEQAEPPSPHRVLMMPRRKRTRAQDRAYRIARERRVNEARIADDQRRKHRAWRATLDKRLTRNGEPPPF
jgi:Domain of unknown function (DUF222)